MIELTLPSGRTFEDGYGKPFGGELYEYVMFETHYNNPDHLDGEKDSASYTFSWSDKPVDTEVGTLTLGDLQTDGWFLEPGQPLVKHSTVCTPECTDNWPDEGITAVAVFHHMHFRGVNAEVQIIRDGKEIAPLSTLRDFEYGYQFSKTLDNIQLFPGDQLITSCYYDTSNDTEPVPGGLASKEEMCFAWVGKSLTHRHMRQIAPLSSIQNNVDDMLTLGKKRLLSGQRIDRLHTDGSGSISTESDQWNGRTLFAVRSAGRAKYLSLQVLDVFL